MIYLIFLETPADDIGLPNRNLPTLFLTESITRFRFNIEETGGEENKLAAPLNVEIEKPPHM